MINGLTKLTHPCQIMADVHDLRGASRADHGPHGGLDRATPTTCWPPGSTRRRGFDFTLKIAVARRNSRPVPSF